VNTTALAKQLLTADVAGTADALEELAGDVIADLERVVPEAACGRERAVALYIVLWRRLEHDLLAALHDARPDLVVQQGDELLVMDVERGGPSAVNALLDAGALEAPFTSWVSDYGAGLGTALSWVARLRACLPDQPPLRSSATEVWTVPFDCDDTSVRRFFRRASSALGKDQPLARIVDVFDLSATELGRLFGVSRQAASQWLEEGPPAARAAKVNAVARIVDVLERNLRSERIPGIVREAADAYAGLSMLEMIEQDRHEELLRQVTGAFDWATTA
jgi:hypothetical protein